MTFQKLITTFSFSDVQLRNLIQEALHKNTPENKEVVYCKKIEIKKEEILNNHQNIKQRISKNPFVKVLRDQFN